MILGPVFGFLLCFIYSAESFGTHDLGRIIGGEPANITDFPYQLSLEAGIFFFFTHICGASIIHSSWALTAAHCILPIPGIKLRLRAGSSDRMSGGTLHDVEDVYIHPEFDGGHIFDAPDYDVAVIKVATPFQYSDVTQKILLATETPSSGTPAVVTGWGSLKSNNIELPKQLQMLDVDIVEYKECKLHNTFYFIFLTPRMLCAAVPEGGKSVYVGDSGGPLVVDNYQVGIMSSVVIGNEMTVPAAYTDVSKVREWITSIVGEESIYH